MKAAQLALPIVVATALILAAVGAPYANLQPSALRLAVTAVIAVLAPLYFPGRAAKPGSTALRIFAWSFGAACVAAIVLLGAGGAQQSIGRTLSACVMLMLIVMTTCCFATAFERRLRASAADAQTARETAGRTATVVLALLGSLPLWLGPAGELVARRVPWMLDAIMGMSPLTHLAVASGNDLLRNEWFYRHSNLAALHVSYPGLVAVALAYASILVAVCALALRNPTHDAATFALGNAKP